MSGVAKKKWELLPGTPDIELRRYLIMHGEYTEANYDAFDDKIMYGFPLYPPEDLFAGVGLVKGHSDDYTVTDYIYATTDVKFPTKDWVVTGQSVWIGYVAVATDKGTNKLGKRDILVTWRGSLDTTEWFESFDDSLISASDIFKSPNDPRVHKGVHSVYVTESTVLKYNHKSARDQVLNAVKNLVDRYKDEELSITVTGHSLGAALATLNAADIVANGYNIAPKSAEPCMVSAFVYASPKVGDSRFKIMVDKLKYLSILRVRNKHDVVPGLPSKDDYVDVGKKVEIDTTESSELKRHQNSLPAAHNLENYLHGIAGELVPFDHSLVNKQLDLLKDEYYVPPKWWDPAKNKRMVQNGDGKWVRYGPAPPGPHSA